MSNINSADLLEYIDPAGLSYNEWLSVGMALHHISIHAPRGRGDTSTANQTCWSIFQSTPLVGGATGPEAEVEIER